MVNSLSRIINTQKNKKIFVLAEEEEEQRPIIFVLEATSFALIMKVAKQSQTY